MISSVHGPEDRQKPSELKSESHTKRQDSVNLLNLLAWLSSVDRLRPFNSNFMRSHTHAQIYSIFLLCGSTLHKLFLWRRLNWNHEIWWRLFLNKAKIMLHYLWFRYCVRNACGLHSQDLFIEKEYIEFESIIIIKSSIPNHSYYDYKWFFVVILCELILLWHFLL